MAKCAIAFTTDSGQRSLTIARQKENIMRISKAAFVLVVLLQVGMIGCSSSKPQPAVSSGQPTAGSGVKRYHLEGTVVSLDRQQKRVIVDGKDIPGFMAAMTMPYPVADEQSLDRVKPGDQITADVVAANSDIHLDNVVVVKKSNSQK
jgi:protein SCO1